MTKRKIKVIKAPEYCQREGLTDDQLCWRDVRARGMCTQHYQASRARGEFGKTCTELWCEGGVVALGRCSHHYYIDRKTEKE